MRRTLLSPLLLALLASTALARPVDLDRIAPTSAPLAPSASIDFQTYYFGGTVWAPDSMRWEAVPESVWTFETGVGSHFQHTDPTKNPMLHASMEGWTGLDFTAGDGEQIFRHLSASDFAGSPCVGAPAGLGGDYSFWAGRFESEADSLCWAAGQGYGNNWSVCIAKDLVYDDASCLQLEFTYLLDSEPGFDYAYVYLDSTGSSTVYESAILWRNAGSVTERKTLDLQEGLNLRSDTGPIRVIFCFRSDGAYSDEDGIWPTTCGGFSVDDVVVSSTSCGGSLADTSDFEAGADGWEQELVPTFAAGDLSHLAAVADLPPRPDSLSCDLGDSVLVLFDPLAPSDEPHPLFQDNLALSPWIDLRRANHVGLPGKFVDVGGYFNLSLSNFLFATVFVQWYPDTCSVTGSVRTSDLLSTSSVYMFSPPPNTTSGRPSCGSQVARVELDDLIPDHAEQVRIALGAINYCRFFAWCSGVNNTTPWFDSIRFGISTFGTIQAAIDLAAEGDTVWVPPGTHAGPGNTDLDFGGKNLVLKSVAGPAGTIIHGESQRRLFLFQSGEDSTSVVEGFTIRSGIHLASGIPQNGGGVEIVNGSSPMFRDCVFQNSTGAEGGGVHADATSEPRFLDCTFRDCYADFGGGVSVISGTFDNCVFEENTAAENGGGLWAYAATLTGCEFRDNTATIGGGAYLGAESLADSCTFSANHAGEGGGLRLTGGLARDCTISGNDAEGGGGGVSLWRGFAGEVSVPGRLEDCMVTDNSAGDIGGGVFQVSWTSIMGGVVSGNTASNGGGVGGVGWFDQALLSTEAEAQAQIPDPNLPGLASLTDVVITGNRATQGGGIYVNDLPSGGIDVGFLLTACTISGNHADSGGGVYFSHHNTLLPGDRMRVDAEQTILFGNCADLSGNEVTFVDTAGLVNFTCSNVDVFGIEGPGQAVFNGPQVYQNPEFCSPTLCNFAPTTTGLYELAGSSPNLPTHNSCGVLIGALGEGCSIVDAPREDPPLVVAPALAVNQNPFRGQLAIRYEAPEGSNPVLRIYDVRGALVQDLPLASSRGTATWDGQDRSGTTTPSGVYFLQLVAGHDRRSLRVVRLQ